MKRKFLAVIVLAFGIILPVYAEENVMGLEVATQTEAGN